MHAVADTGPLHYLILTGNVRILPALFTMVAIPDAIRAELAHDGAPTVVRGWIADPPAWLAVGVSSPAPISQARDSLDDGERAVLAMAMSQQPELVLMDDRAGVAAARSRGFLVTGTIGLLVRAARRHLVDLPAALDELSRTNFHWSPELKARVLAEHTKRLGQSE